jgi:hypothetical protein
VLEAERAKLASRREGALVRADVAHRLAQREIDSAGTEHDAPTELRPRQGGASGGDGAAPLGMAVGAVLVLQRAYRGFWVFRAISGVTVS